MFCGEKKYLLDLGLAQPVIISRHRVAEVHGVVRDAFRRALETMPLLFPLIAPPPHTPAQSIASRVARVNQIGG